MSQVVEIEDLSRRFGAVQALADVRLSVPRGVVFGLIGENGAGKTTLIRHLLGLLKPQSGTVRVCGFDPVRQPVEALSRIGYLSENRDLPEELRIAQLLRYLRAFYPTWDESLAQKLLADFDLDPQAKIATLSQGQRARIGLLAAMAHRPDLLILDEPSTGLDPIVRKDVLTAIIRTIADDGGTVLFSSHLLDEVERAADYVAMMREGRIVLSGPLDEVKAAHRRVTLRFADALPAAPDLPGSLTCSGFGREWTAVFESAGPLEGGRRLSPDAEIVCERTPSLDEIFVARAGATAASMARESRS